MTSRYTATPGMTFSHTDPPFDLEKCFKVERGFRYHSNLASKIVVQLKTTVI